MNYRGHILAEGPAREGRPEHPIYRRVSLRDWEQGVFAELSPLPPSGQSLSLALNLSRLSTIIPGLSIAGRGACLDLLSTWTREDIDRCLDDLKAHGACVDLPKSLIFQPWVLSAAAPESPNVVKAWRRRWRELPGCEVVSEIDQHVRLFLINYGASKASKAGEEPSSWVRAWDPRWAESSAEDRPSLGQSLPEGLVNPSQMGTAGKVELLPESGISKQDFSSDEPGAAVSNQVTDGIEQPSGRRKGKSVEKGKPLGLGPELGVPFECTCGELVQSSADGTKWNADGHLHRHIPSADVRDGFGRGGRT